MAAFGLDTLRQRYSFSGSRVERSVKSVSTSGISVHCRRHRRNMATRKSATKCASCTLLFILKHQHGRYEGERKLGSLNPFNHRFDWLDLKQALFNLEVSKNDSSKSPGANLVMRCHFHPLNNLDEMGKQSSHCVSCSLIFLIYSMLSPGQDELVKLSEGIEVVGSIKS